MLPSKLYDTLCQTIDALINCLEEENKLINTFSFENLKEIISIKKSLFAEYEEMSKNFLANLRSIILSSSEKQKLEDLSASLHRKIMENQEALSHALSFNDKMIYLVIKGQHESLRSYTPKGSAYTSTKPMQPFSMNTRL